jgi:hypothetical protein
VPQWDSFARSRCAWFTAEGIIIADAKAAFVRLDAVAQSPSQIARPTVAPFRQLVRTALPGQARPMPRGVTVNGGSRSDKEIGAAPRLGGR